MQITCNWYSFQNGRIPQKQIKLRTYKNTLPAMANILSENKIPLKTITDRVGHSDSEVTTSIYTHVTKNMKDEAIDVLDKVMKKIF